MVAISYQKKYTKSLFRKKYKTMTITLDTTEAAIVRGIKTVGIGKKGSKPLNAGLVHDILTDLKSGRVSQLEQGAFLGGLWIKGVTPEEVILESFFGYKTFTDPKSLIHSLAPEAPGDIQNICVDLLQGRTLDTATAYRLGQFLLSNEPGEGARGLTVSILRVRYETNNEYEGLLKSFQNSLEPAFCTPTPLGEDIIQLAEPFDGVDHSYLITPCIAQYFQELDYRVITLVGRNSGPKYGNNLLDLAKALAFPLVKGNHELSEPKPALGWYFNQEDMSKPLDRWVERRRKTIKRPCFSTLEKFLNPVQAKIIITSAFHPPYGEKMLTIAERAGFAGSIVVRNGLEGTIAFPLKREAKILCSACQQDGTYLRHEINFDPVKFLGYEIDIEEVLEKPSLEENTKLVKSFALHGKTNNKLFDDRVRVTCAGLQLGVQWIEENISKEKET